MQGSLQAVSRQSPHFTSPSITALCLCLFPTCLPGTQVPAAYFLSCGLTHASSTVLWVHPLPRAFLSCIATALSHQARFHPWVSDRTPDIHQTPILWGHVLQKASTASRDLKSLPQSRGRWELIIELQHCFWLQPQTSLWLEKESGAAQECYRYFHGVMAPRYPDTWSYLL